jgi:copper homeostasis protein
MEAKEYHRSFGVGSLVCFLCVMGSAVCHAMGPCDGVRRRLEVDGSERSQVSAFADRAVVLEACVASVADAVVAVQNGAQRLELNVGIEVGGLTPTVGLLGQVKEAVDVPVLVLVRPRAGGFCYSPSEKRLMIRDAHAFMDMGADGIVTGALSTDGLLDKRFVESMREVCREGELVFHRAFDLLQGHSDGLEELVALRADRILTSGGETSALAGAVRIAELLKLADGRISILPGGGICSQTVGALLKATGCSQVHGTFKMLRVDPDGNVGSGSYPAVDSEEVKAVRGVLDRYRLEAL